MFKDSVASLYGSFGIIGRTIVLHWLKDDLGKINNLVFNDFLINLQLKYILRFRWRCWQFGYRQFGCKNSMWCHRHFKLRLSINFFRNHNILITFYINIYNLQYNINQSINQSVSNFFSKSINNLFFRINLKELKTNFYKYLFLFLG